MLANRNSLREHLKASQITSPFVLSQQQPPPHLQLVSTLIHINIDIVSVSVYKRISVSVYVYAYAYVSVYVGLFVFF